VCICMYVCMHYVCLQHFQGDVVGKGSVIQLQFWSFAKLAVEVVCEVMSSSRTSVLDYHLVQSTSQIDDIAMSNLLQCSL
jgi:hypothetical protein